MWLKKHWLLALIAFPVISFVLFRSSGDSPKQVFRPGPSPEELNQTTEIYVQLSTESVHLNKQVLGETNLSPWQVDTWGGLSVLDTRANQGLVLHFMDILKGTLGRYLDPKSLKGFLPIAGNNFLLRVAMNLNGSAEDLGFKINQQEDSYAEIADFKRLSTARTSPQLITFFSHKTLLDFRDRRITNFETDDVEEIKLAGKKCAKIQFARDGDLWFWKSAKKINNVEAWLDKILAVHYEQAPEKTDQNLGVSQKPLCSLEIKGRKGRKEGVVFFEYDHEYWAINSTLEKAVYKISKNSFDLLLNL
jgi:hypothetical protein